MPNILVAVNEALRIADDDTHGYDQRHRNGPDYDCSSYISTCLNIAGFDISPNSWTGNMLAQLKKCGFVEIKKGPWKAGDIHLNPGSHVVMSANETDVFTASKNEKGTAVGGKTGDQTGKEIYIRKYYGTWKYHLRYPQSGGSYGQNELDAIARACIAGKYGNFPERKTKVEALGFKYEDVQKRINTMLHTVDSNGEIRELGEVARDVIKGKYGIYPKRKQIIEAMGLDYNEVQKLVTSMMKGKK